MIISNMSSTIEVVINFPYFTTTKSYSQSEALIRTQNIKRKAAKTLFSFSSLFKIFNVEYAVKSIIIEDKISTNKEKVVKINFLMTE